MPEARKGRATDRPYGHENHVADSPLDSCVLCASFDRTNVPFDVWLTGYSSTGNLAAVMRTMGHRDVKTAMHYQHPELEIVRAALDYVPPATEAAA
jgi:hypothetical protein